MTGATGGAWCGMYQAVGDGPDGGGGQGDSTDSTDLSSARG